MKKLRQLVSGEWMVIESQNGNRLAGPFGTKVEANAALDGPVAPKPTGEPVEAPQGAVEAVTEPPKRKPGRPPKSATL